MSEQNLYQVPQKSSELQQSYQEVNILSRRGRLGRLRYLVYLAFAYFIVGIGVFLGGSLELEEEFGSFARQGIDIPIMIFSILMLIAGVILTYNIVAKRLQDFNINGTFGIIWFAVGIFLLPPPIGLLLLLIICVIPGSKGENRFGLPPYPNSTGIKVAAALIFITMVLSVIIALGILIMVLSSGRH